MTGPNHSNLPCDRCTAACCRRRPGQSVAAVVEADELLKHRHLLVPHADGLALVPFRESGKCIFLSNNRCSLGEGKPRECQAFRCNEHEPFLRHHPAVIALLTREGVPLVAAAN